MNLFSLLRRRSKEALAQELHAIEEKLALADKESASVELRMQVPDLLKRHARLRDTIAYLAAKENRLP